MSRELLYDTIMKIELSQIRNYLTLNGWKQNYEFPNMNQILFHNQIEEQDILLSAKETFKDFTRSVYDCVKILADIEERSMNDIIDDIIKINVDRLSFRIVSKETERGSIPLLAASDILEALKKLIIDASSNEYLPKPYYLKKPKVAIDNSNQFSFAQTKVGSFIFNVESVPIEINETPQLNWGDSAIIVDSQNVPITRKIIVRIINSMNQLEEAQSRDSIDDILNKGYIRGLNANMCDSLLEMLPSLDEDSSNILGFSLSPCLEQMDIKTKIAFPLKRTYEPILRAVSEKFKEENDEIESISIIGYVKKLVSENPTSDDDSKTIQVCIVDGPEGIHSCFISLNVRQYAIAGDAHMKNTFLLFEGNLVKRNNRWWLDNVSSMHPYNED